MTSKGIFISKNIESVGGVPQSELKLTQYFDAGGVIPAHIIHKRLPLIISIVKNLSDAFKRDDEIDGGEK